jgi:hypothetical protein
MMKASTKARSPARAFAEECLSWANKTRNQKQRIRLIEIARTWTEIALEIEDRKSRYLQTDALPHQ